MRQQALSLVGGTALAVSLAASAGVCLCELPTSEHSCCATQGAELPADDTTCLSHAVDGDAELPPAVAAPAPWPSAAVASPSLGALNIPSVAHPVPPASCAPAILRL